jgi:arylsulfatase A-like enzyme
MNYWGGESTGARAPMALDDRSYTPPNENFFATDAFTKRAIVFVDEAKAKNQPFFLYLAYNAPHWPLHAPPEDIEQYKGKYDVGWQQIRDERYRRMVELGIIAASTTMAPMDRGAQRPWDELTAAQRQEWSLRMAIYAAQVTRMDRNIGRLMEKLNELGVAENTLIFFFSDNGGAAEDPHRGKAGAALGSRDSFWGYARPWASVSNTPWRNHKISAYEGGISTPAIVHWRAGVPKSAVGQLARQPAHLLDVMPTLLELCGVDYPSTETRRLEGRSILSMIRGEAGEADRIFCWEHEGNRAIRKGKWKLVTLASSKTGWELYDIEADRSETHNLREKHPDVVAKLSAEYDEWARRCGVVPWAEIAPKRPPQNQ